MKLIVGLGNPGNEYDLTRHNIGYQMLDRIIKDNDVVLSKTKFDGLYGEKMINGEKIIFLKPLRYMNLSGSVIIEFINYFKIDIKDILIIHDDLDTNIGTFRLRYKGSSGGHNGLKNIEENLHTNQYNRIKIGISNNKGIDTKNYVLGKFSLEEQKLLSDVEQKISLIFNDYLKLTFENLMNKYN